MKLDGLPCTGVYQKSAVRGELREPTGKRAAAAAGLFECEKIGVIGMIETFRGRDEVPLSVCRPLTPLYRGH